MTPLPHRPPNLTDEEWADYRQCQAEHDDLLSQVADREAQIEHGWIDSYDEYEFAWGEAVPGTQSPQPAVEHELPSTALGSRMVLASLGCTPKDLLAQSPQMSIAGHHARQIAETAAALNTVHAELLGEAARARSRLDRIISGQDSGQSDTYGVLQSAGVRVEILYAQRGLLAQQLGDLIADHGPVPRRLSKPPVPRSAAPPPRPQQSVGRTASAGPHRA
ncbi:hypothetical protein [Streptomyces sp. CT34]|uniref:hypothetical protein n=1 Tax=Streptomyces sp. CT34 TaxID=1553907 RepID=UPI0005BC34E2|nr:hypothetical protein [Streptomyces sp. CT34]